MNTQTTKPDLYTWQVRYADATWFSEFDDESPTGRGWAEVGQAQVQYIDLLGQGRAFRVRIPADAMPVFFRRRRIELHPSRDEEHRTTVHCIGWKTETSACYLFIFEDSSTLLTSDLQAV